MAISLWEILMVIVALVVTVAVQTAAMLGIMWILHKLAAEKMPNSNYLEFDFDNFQKPALIELLLKLVIIIAPATFILHLFAVLFSSVNYPFCFNALRRHPHAWGFSFMILEGAAIAAGLFLLLKLDRTRILILASASALFYIIYYAVFLQGQGILL